MVPRIDVAALQIDRSPEALASNRQKTLDRIAQWKNTDAELERLCKERGVKVPVLMC